MNRITIVLLAAVLACGRPDAAPAAQEASASKPASRPLPVAFDQTIPGTTATLHMVPVPAPAGGGAPFLISSTEVTWDVYDVFALRLDDPGNTSADAITRPSKPYLPPDYGWGHAGYPAMSVTFEAACKFCDWLSRRTGRRYRLPTEAEWEHAARAGATSPWCFGSDANAIVDWAWCAVNADDTTHPVARKKPNALGLYDVHGNVAEWCVTADLKAVTCGGSFRDDPSQLDCAARVPPTRAWQRTDPQEPKSSWWLSDGPFVGFRVVTDVLPKDLER
jgi:formylglycine-generating enzyme required for sulfatase activity